MKISKFNPKFHHRRSIRLKGYDYSRNGAYYITICCAYRQCRFGAIIENEMVYNAFGEIAYMQWIKLPDRFFNFQLDVFQIMPNHMHAIVILDDTVVGATLAVAPQDADDNPQILTNPRARASHAPTIGDIIGVYKSIVSNKCLEIFKSQNEIMGKLWQRNYFEHIIRSQQSYNRIASYILNNPANWPSDSFFTR